MELSPFAMRVATGGHAMNLIAPEGHSEAPMYIVGVAWVLIAILIILTTPKK